MKKFLVGLCAVFFVFPVMAECTSDQIDIAGDGTQCETTKFSVTTESNTTTFFFEIAAYGTFYVDCGNNGTLTDANNNNLGKTIIRTNSVKIFSCAWSTGAPQTIRFGGSATRYETTINTSAISFYAGGTSFDKSNNAKKVASISGSLGQIFPLTTGTTPRFYRTFYGCTGLKSIPDGLFSGIVSSVYTNKIRSGMFYRTFYGCTGLKSIPDRLFSDVHTSSCTDVSDMFNGTFYGCTGLTNIPDTLFSDIDTSSSTNTKQTFYRTFYGCTELTSISDMLFDGIDTSSSTNTKKMFYETFKGCSKLITVINNNTGTRYVPGGYLSNITSTATDVAQNMFADTILADLCPTGTTDTTPVLFSNAGKPWCEELSTGENCFSGQYLPANSLSCITCPLNNACVGGTYSFNETADQGIVACVAPAPFAPTGSAVCYQHILHVGNDNIYLRSTKQTTPSLNIQIGNDIFYANTTTTPTYMNKDSTHYMHILYEGDDYYVCDDTTYVAPSE